MADGAAYDAELHAIFLGFVMSMILGHAPMVVPSVLGRPLPFRNWDGSLNEIAVLLFLTMAVVPVIGSRRAARRSGSTLRPTAAAPPGNAAGSSQDLTVPGGHDVRYLPR